MTDFLYRLYHRLVILRPRTALALVVLILAGLASGLPNFKLDASADSLTLEQDAAVDYFREISKRYQSGDFLVVTYKPSAPLMSDAVLAELEQLQNALAEVQGVVSVNSILNVPLLYSPLIGMGELANPPTLAEGDVDRELARAEFLQSPVYKEMLLGPDGQTTALLLNLAVDETYIALVRERDRLRQLAREGSITPAQAQQLRQASAEFLAYRTAEAEKAAARVAQVRSIVAGYKGGAQIYLGGVTMITADMIAFIKSDLLVFGSAILVFIVVLMTIIFRNWVFVVLPLMTAVGAVLAMLGWLSWVDWRLTVISSNFVALLLIIGLAITIHLVVRYRELAAHQPDATQQQLVEATVQLMFKPIVYTVLTTMVAFASLVVSNIRPVMDFGWMMVIGLSVATLLAFVIIPAGLMWAGRARLAAAAKADDNPAFTLIFARFTERYGAWVLTLALLLAVVAGVGISQLKVENRFIDYFRSSTEIYQGMTVIDQNLGGTATLDILLEGPASEPLDDNAAADPFNEVDAFDTPDPFDAPEPVIEADPFAEVDPFSEQNPNTQARESYWFTGAGLTQIEQLHDYLETLPEVGKVQSLATAYKVARDINGAPLNDFELAVLRQSLPENVYKLLVAPYLSAEHNQARITLRVKETDPNLRRAELIEKIRTRATDGTMGFAPEQVSFSGVLVLYNNMLQSLFHSQIVTLGAVFLGIALMMSLLFRSLLLALVGILPNLLAAAVVLGAMGLAGIALDMMTITIAAIVVGIGVDNTIHYMHRFRHEFAACGEYLPAMHRAHGSIGRALFYTSVIIIQGFSILALSNFIPSVYFGLLTALAMLAAILAALTLLPKLILVLKPFGAEAPRAA
ncbi:MMPL family transporter [Simiduia sp. 21SJ11W-1]|uniref:efflux RND transporter permease subunit n=1 Tax=Simiduia sp. 21SJ11W-1 TaxID=2909669 RepID=UPI00209CE6D3|nr:MMPL family transporter [Simiduia sp. 21SJ11W-1]UTA48691.1 MMPL family transporter [Simiduia sp. 21SJ11W-1]